MSSFIDFLSQGFKVDMAAGNPFAGVFGIILRSLGSLLAGIYAVIPSYAVAIAGLTILVRALLWPLTAKQTRSMAAMQKLQPEIQELRKKHKADRVKLNEEMMALYQERKVNPLGGCLPLLIQGPILFTLWRVLGVAYGAPRMKPFSGAVTDFCTNELGQPSQCVTGTAFLPQNSRLFEAIQHHQVHFFGIDLTRPGSGQLGIGVVTFIILVLGVVATMWYQQRQMQKRSGGMNPQMQAMSQIMPLVFGFFTWNLAGGLGIYFVVGNLFQITQQAVMFRRSDAETVNDDKAIATKTVDEKPDRRSGFLASMRERAGLATGATETGSKSTTTKTGAGKTEPGATKSKPAGGVKGSQQAASRTAGGANRSKKKRKKKGR